MRSEFELTLRLDCTIDQIWDAIERPALFIHVAGPLVRAAPLDPLELPEKWEEREYRVAMRLFGVIPIGWQAIIISYPEVTADRRVLHDQGYGPMLKGWSHRIEVVRDCDGVLYSDKLAFDSGLLTPLAAPLIRLFFRHRQRRLRALVESGIERLSR